MIYHNDVTSKDIIRIVAQTLCTSPLQRPMQNSRHPGISCQATWLLIRDHESLPDPTVGQANVLIEPFDGNLNILKGMIELIPNASTIVLDKVWEWFEVVRTGAKWFVVVQEEGTTCFGMLWNGLRLVQVLWSNSSLFCLRWFWMVWSGSKYVKAVFLCSPTKKLEMVQSGQNWPKVVQSCVEVAKGMACFRMALNI